MSVSSNPVALRSDAFGAEPSAAAVARPRLAAGAKALLLIVIAKAFVLGFMALSYTQVELSEPGFKSIRTGLLQDDSFLMRFTNWDGRHYLLLAEDGYQRYLHMSNAFAPVFPFLIRGLTLVTGDSVVSGLIVSNVASVAALWLLWSLVQRRWGESVAWRTLLLLLAFPTAFFLSMVYTESLFLLLAVATFWGMEQATSNGQPATRPWGFVIAAVAAFLLPLTRWIGVLIVAPLALWALLRVLRQAEIRGGDVLREPQDEQIERAAQDERGPVAGGGVLRQAQDERFSLGSLRWDASMLLVLAPLAGAAVYLAFMQAATGDYLGHVHATVFYPSQWSLGNVLRPGLFVENLLAASQIHGVLNSALDRIFFIGFVASMPLVYRKLGGPLFVFYLTMGLQPLLGSFMSYTRYLLPAFPLYIAYARALEGRTLLTANIVTVMVLLQAGFVVLFAGAYWVA